MTSNSMSRKTIAVTINPPVSSMLMWGVLKRSLIRANSGGSNRSLLIARGYRDAASMPPFAVVTKAAMAAKPRIAKPKEPINLLAARDIGI